MATTTPEEPTTTVASENNYLFLVRAEDDFGNEEANIRSSSQVTFVDEKSKFGITPPDPIDTSAEAIRDGRVEVKFKLDIDYDENPWAAEGGLWYAKVDYRLVDGPTTTPEEPTTTPEEPTTTPEEPTTTPEEPTTTPEEPTTTPEEPTTTPEEPTTTPEEELEWFQIADITNKKYTDGPPLDDGLYHYRIKAVNEDGRISSPSNVKSFEITTAPEPPRNFRLSLSEDHTKIVLKWLGSTSSNVSHYNIYCSNGKDRINITTDDDIIDTVEHEGEEEHEYTFELSSEATTTESETTTTNGEATTTPEEEYDSFGQILGRLPQIGFYTITGSLLNLSEAIDGIYTFEVRLTIYHEEPGGIAAVSEEWLEVVFSVLPPDPPALEGEVI